jgi:Leucine carboxyl methyltransferase
MSAFARFVILRNSGLLLVELPETATVPSFDRLDRHGGASSPDIWKSIFWLQQRPGEPSAQAAYAHGRQAYLPEIALRDNFFATTAPTAWIAEGLLPYLPPDAQDQLLDNITTLTAPDSRLATENITDMSVFTDERARSLRSNWRKHGLDIDVADLVWAGNRRQAGDHLTSTGWRVTQYATEQLYAVHGFAVPDNEIIAQFRGAISYISAKLG